MNRVLSIILLLVLASCGHAHKPTDKTILIKAKAKTRQPLDSTQRPATQFSDQQLEAFLDSVGKLPAQPLADKVAFGPDSVFKSPRQLDTLISPTDVKILMHAAHKGVIAVKTARRILNNNQISYDCNSNGMFLTYKVGLISVKYYPFNTSRGEYGIGFGDPGECESAYLYFFKDDRIIAKHNLYERFSDGLRWFKGEDGELRWLGKTGQLKCLN